MLDQLDLVPFRCVYEGDDGAGRGVVRAVAEGITLRCRLLGKGLQIGDFKGKVGQIGAHLHGAAGIILADLDEFLAPGGLEKDELRSASAFAAAHLLQTQHISVEADSLLKVVNAVAGMKELCDHGSRKG